MPASSLLQTPDLSRTTQRELKQAIVEEAEQLNRRVANLLDMTRLQSGSLELNREWVSLEELVGSALGPLEGTRRLCEWSAVPIIVVSARGEEKEKIEALDAGAEVHLTRTEYRLLALLVKHAGKVLTHRQLLKEVWGPGSVDQSHYLRVYMGQLRHKLEKDPARPRILVTETGVGYRLKVE